MQRLSLILLYIICAFLPVLLVWWQRRSMSLRSFWFSWLIALTGAFAGGSGGVLLMNRWGWESPYASAFPALLLSWCLLAIHLKLRDLPEA